MKGYVVFRNYLAVKIPLTYMYICKTYISIFEHMVSGNDETFKQCFVLVRLGRQHTTLSI